MSLDTPDHFMIHLVVHVSPTALFLEQLENMYPDDNETGTYSNNSGSWACCSKKLKNQ